MRVGSKGMGGVAMGGTVGAGYSDNANKVYFKGKLSAMQICHLGILH